MKKIVTTLKITHRDNDLLRDKSTNKHLAEMKYNFVISNHWLKEILNEKRRPITLSIIFIVIYIKIMNIYFNCSVYAQKYISKCFKAI